MAVCCREYSREKSNGVTSVVYVAGRNMYARVEFICSRTVLYVIEYRHYNLVSIHVQKVTVLRSRV